ncbi:hypothetical protein KCV06_g224, partial [Aureobasidium melanogenum]
MPVPAVTQRRSHQYFDIGCVQQTRLTVSLTTRAVRDIRMIGCQNTCMARPSLDRLVTWRGLSILGK